MSEEIKRVSVNAFEKATESDYVPYSDIEWRGIQIRVNTCIDFQSMVSFVNSVIDMCFMDDTGEYLPELEDYAIRCAMIHYYTNISLPENIERRYALMYGSDIISTVVSRIDSNQLSPMLAAIDKKISARVQSNIEAMNMKMNDVIASFSELEERLSKAFDGIDSNVISQVAGAISNGAFDEDKLVKAITDSKNSGESNAN